jgi:DNA-binding MarR family transcriptional regulator
MTETEPQYKMDENQPGGGINCIAFRTRRLARLATRFYEKELKDTGLTAQQFSVLSVLRSRGPNNAGELAKTLDLEKSTMSRNILLLKKKELIEASPDGPGRAPLTLTPKGRRLLAKALPKWQKAQRATLYAIGEDGEDLLEQMTAALEAYP